MADKPKKTQKLKARLPRGLADRGPAEIAATRAMVEKIREVYERYGFEPVETPAMEYTDALGKFLPDQDRPNEGVFSFQDDDEQWISLRYDLTAPLARYVAERYGTENIVLPYRSYRFGYVYRNEKPGPGRFRQFMQFDADTVGTASGGQSAAAADAEMCMMAADTMEALGIPRGSYRVKVNNRKILDGLMESIGLGGDSHAKRRLTVFRAIDKLDRLGVPGVRQLLGPGRWDGGEPEKGDFTEGAGLADSDIVKVLNIIGGAAEAWISPKPDSSPPTDDETYISGELLFANKGPEYDKGRGEQFYPDQDKLLNMLFDSVRDSKVGVEGVAELRTLLDLCRACGYGSKRIEISSSVVRGLEYYTGPVYEVEVSAIDDNNRPISFGSVGGGGRYDGLVSRFRGEPVPATGFSIGVSRLQALLKTIGMLDTKPEFGPVVVTVFDRDRVADYQKMVAVLRAAKIRAELYLGNPKNMGNQLKYADRRNSPCVIIQGSDEKARGEVQIKDLIEGARAAAAIASNQEWRESRPAQFSCKEDELVARVREVLARHEVKWG
ncbi:MAG: histidine--tRNA ligase [Bradyrhizobium sp.]|jgi:histidyl-tRNA synthetase|nr:HisS family protein [Bradyrhizobium sp.]THD51800.1 MAG: histidine--tRNA ligase [Bradyrhizobium sp.]